ncbi:MAG: hypothetical protein Q8P59_01295, partial [Dehalococcoidia bacterium]|nr:hypothetical protein [Dehalococcoidia bacterium]
MSGKQSDRTGSLLGLSSVVVQRIKKGWASQERAIISTLSILAFLTIWEVVVIYFKRIDPLFASAP